MNENPAATALNYPSAPPAPESPAAGDSEAIANAEAPAAASFSRGDLVVHTWHDQYSDTEHERTGMVVDVPEPEGDEAQTVKVAWLDTATVPAADVAAVSGA